MDYTVLNKRVSLLLLMFTLAISDEPPKFHTQLSPEERRHYFGTELIEEVPDYVYTSPQHVDRRRKRDTEEPEDSLQYSIDMFGLNIHLELYKNTDLISPGCMVQHLTANETIEVYPCNSQEVDCLYTGSSRNHSDSWVAASLCRGMHAMIGLPNKTLVIQPIREQHLSRVRRDTRLSEPHIVYEYHLQKRGCSSDKSTVEAYTNPDATRVRRSTGRRYVETTVVVDPTSYNFHGSDTERMVSTIMNIMAQRYLDSSLGTSVYFTLNKIKILHQIPSDLTINVDSGITLDSFCNWQSEWNSPQDSDPNHSDYVVLITKVDLEDNGEKTNTGLARKGMCGEKTKCSVNEDNGLGTGLIIAHETGHVLGMNHDAEGNDCKNGIHIMSSMAPSGPNALKWSRCSAKYLSDYLRSSESQCLNDVPPASFYKLYENTTKPGTIYSANQQCKLMYGNEAEICEGVHANGQDVCGAIVCRAKHNTGVNGCIINASPRMDGTECGNRKWCIGGQCVQMGAGDPAPRNGGWSQWESQYGKCSRSCGGGVKVKRRFCNNPEPMYGGKECVGESLKAELCNLEGCINTQYDFRAQQCAATDNDPVTGRTFHWKPNSDSLGDNSCKINCIAEGANVYAKRGINIDGTECFMASHAPFTRCVRGQCKEFGCDGHVGSTSGTYTKYDQCGLCNGKGNTCRKISGSCHQGQPLGFYTFVTIPVGSTGIKVTQKNPFCYLSAVINNQQLFSKSKPNLSGSYRRGNFVIKYDTSPERMEIVGPINTTVKFQVFMKYNHSYQGIDPEIEYEYHVPTIPQAAVYMWKTKAGSCSKTCGTGEYNPIITCESSVSGTVDDYYCNIYQKPVESPQPCNTHPCPPRWITLQWGQCSKTCGGGQQYRTVKCVEENNNVEHDIPESRCHSLTKPMESSTCNRNDCPGTWSTGAWSTCSESCARGIKNRTVTCHRNGVVVSSDNCITADKPKTEDYCVVRPCRTDISGSSCVDEKDNCFGSYGEDVCTGAYKAWARTHCMKSCGMCFVNPIGDCQDTVTNCNKYQDGFCTNSQYATWAKNHCKKFCGYCEVTITPRPNQATVLGDCSDTDDCPAYGRSVCTEFVGWANKHCKKYCNLCEDHTNAPTSKSEHLECKDTAYCEGFGKGVCEITDFANTQCRKYCGLCEGCADQEENCAAYGSSVCTEYEGWASKHCQGYCGLCRRRRKRSLLEYDDEELNAPPLIDGSSPPLAVEETKDILVKELLKLSTSENQMTDDHIIDVLSNVDKIPTEPLCDTVRTATSGNLDMIGKLLPGEHCVQTISLPEDKKIVLKIIDQNLDCNAGDSLQLIDVIQGETIDICDITQSEWTSDGNIVVVKVISGSEGHGVSYTYHSEEQTKQHPACNQYLIDVAGDIQPIRYPSGSKSSDDECNIYITATPGNSVQLVFNKFDMTDAVRKQCVTVTDLENGEEDIFCGELSPFIWESLGSLVRLSYKHSSPSDGFDITYTVQK
ncbi:A disintegrin and metalloproteinase [Mactra antiquata]